MYEKHTFGKRTKHDKNELKNIIIKTIKEATNNGNKYDEILDIRCLDHDECINLFNEYRKNNKEIY